MALLDEKLPANELLASGMNLRLTKVNEKAGMYMAGGRTGSTCAYNVVYIYIHICCSPLIHRFRFSDLTLAYGYVRAGSLWNNDYREYNIRNKTSGSLCVGFSED